MRFWVIHMKAISQRERKLLLCVNMCENYTFKIIATSPMGNELNSPLLHDKCIQMHCIKLANKSHLELIKYTKFLTLMGELESVCFEYYRNIDNILKWFDSVTHYEIQNQDFYPQPIWAEVYHCALRHLFVRLSCPHYHSTAHITSQILCILRTVMDLDRGMKFHEPGLTLRAISFSKRC